MVHTAIQDFEVQEKVLLATVPKRINNLVGGFSIQGQLVFQDRNKLHTQVEGENKRNNRSWLSEHSSAFSQICGWQTFALLTPCRGHGQSTGFT